MAVGPRKSDPIRLKKAEAQIDQYLKNGRPGEDRQIIATKLIDITYAEFNKELAPKYREAGWRTVKWVCDQRDGDYLEFSV